MSSQPEPMRSQIWTRRRFLMVGTGIAFQSALGHSDSWAASGNPAGSTHFDSALLQKAVDQAAGFNRLHSLVISRGGQIAVAEAFRADPVDRPVNVKSVSKTIVAALTGAALTHRAIEDVNASIGSLAPDLLPDGADPRVRDITIADLLTMQAGLERTSGPNYGRWVQSPDWVRFVLTRPFIAEPGQRMLYSTGSYHVLGAVLSRLTGRNLLDLARSWLGEPLGIDIPAWTRDPQGFYLGGNNMALSPLALIRFGELFRLGGILDGRRVVSDRWVRESWTSRTFSPFSGHDYGFGWFLPRANGHLVAYARGYGGQMLYVVPSLGLTVAITSDPTRPARSRGYAGQLNALMSQQIIPAAELA